MVLLAELVARDSGLWTDVKMLAAIAVGGCALFVNHLLRLRGRGHRG